MNDFDIERELHKALQRVEPARDFSLPFAKAPTKSYTWMALAAALILVLLTPLGVLRYQARQMRGEEARAQLVTALRITSNKLQKTRQLVVRELNRRNSL